jgi:hypothetical protein
MSAHQSKGRMWKQSPSYPLPEVPEGVLPSIRKLTRIGVELHQHRRRMCGRGTFECMAQGVIGYLADGTRGG